MFHYIFAKLWTFFNKNYPLCMLENVLCSTIKNFCTNNIYSLQTS